MTTKPFHLGDILSATTGILVSPRGIGGVYEILNFLTGDNLFTHQLPRGVEICGPFLLEKYPKIRPYHDDCLSAARGPGWGEATAEAWMIAAAAKFCVGPRFAPYLELEPMPEGQWLRIDPVQEARAMMGDERVVVVELGGEEPR